MPAGQELVKLGLAKLVTLGLLGLASAVMVKVPQAKDGDRRLPLLVVFGDSLSDQGNLLALTNNQDPEPRLYYKGRFTNKYCWVDYLDHAVDTMEDTEKAKWTVLNYAYGGSTACGPTILFIGPPPLAAQVQSYVDGKLPVKDLNSSFLANFSQSVNILVDIVIMEGANDYIASAIAASESARDTPVDEAVQKIMFALKSLPRRVTECILEEVRAILKVTKDGYPGSGSIPPHTVRSISVASLPELEGTPIMRSILGLESKALKALGEAEVEHSRLLREGLQQLTLQQDKEAHTPILAFLDLNSLTQDLYNNPSALGLTNITDPCLQHGPNTEEQAKEFPCPSDASELPIRLNPTTPPPYPHSPSSPPLSGSFEGCCLNPASYFFYDNVHPTSTIHYNASLSIRELLESLRE